MSQAFVLKGFAAQSRRAMAPQAGPTEESRINAWFNLAFATRFIISLLEWLHVFFVLGISICVYV